MTYWFWLGRDAEPIHDGETQEADFLRSIEDDGFITIIPQV